MPHKVFLDTNVWYSALYGSATCNKILQAHIDGKITAILSQKVLDELIKNLHKKIPYALPTFKRILISIPPQVVPDPTQISTDIRKYVDAKDQKIFMSAQKAKVRYFVTGNIKDFSIKELEAKTGVKTISPREAVELLHL